jgi:beta-N-acetylhexosaminidase
MAVIFAAVRLAVVLALLPFAYDWRSPLLASIRPWTLAALILVPLSVAAWEVLRWRRMRGAGRLRRSLGVATLAVALVVFATALWFEARFHWMRHEVLHADPQRLELLGRHVVVGYKDLAEVRALIERRAVAGVFLTARNARDKSAQGIKQEVAGLQAIRSQHGLPPLWVATDQEGGSISRLSPPLTRTPSLADVVAAHSDAAERLGALRRMASTHGRELAEIGVNVNFAPVIDLDHRVFNPDDRYTRIHQRAISSDPQVVRDIADAYCSALAAAGVHCTLKHFPGLGRVFEDTHLQGADLLAPADELTATDWVPFRALMPRPGSFMMLGHARLAAVDRARPASFSESVVAGLLRREWQHDGVLVTDDYCMGAVYASPQGIGNAGIDALNAGVDLILIAYDPDQYYPVMYALLKAQSEGRLRPELLEKSDARLRHATRAVAPNRASPLSP